MTRRPARRGFTLIELLVAMGIMLVLATLAVLFLPHLNRNKGVPNAATQVQGWINLAKQQALRDGAPRGIRISQDPNSADPYRGVLIQYIEQPEPIAPRGPGLKIIVHSEIFNDPILFPQTNATVDPNTGEAIPPQCGRLSVVTLIQDNPTAPVVPPAGGPYGPQFAPSWKPWDGVEPNDYFELSGNVPTVARITRVPKAVPVYPPTQAAGNPLAQITLDRVIDGTEAGTAIHMPGGFRILRSPRPLAGEPMLQIHRDVYIDLTACFPCPLMNTVPMAPGFDNPNYNVHQPWSPVMNPAPGPGEQNYIDILFNSSGVVGNAPSGQLILTLRHVDRPNEIVLLTIYTRTGKISAHQVYDVPGADPFSLTRDGRSSGL
jgi:prepilin-type N-terminal cleavage/methylation domain-containing protein